MVSFSINTIWNYCEKYITSVKGSFRYNYEFTNIHVSDLNKIRNLLEIGSEQLKKNGVYLLVKNLVTF